MNTRWVVDECEDAYGNYTIREDDGTDNGDIYQEPIATVYDYNIAQLICSQHNAMENM